MAFKNLDKYVLNGDSRYWMDFPELGRKARLLLAFAGDANPNYYNAMLALSGKRVRRLAKQDNITAEDAAQSRDEDKELYPLFILKGWECVEGDEDDGPEELDANGYMPYNRRKAQQLCDCLANHLMDRIRNEAATPERFYPADAIVPPDADELAEN